ncbi:hypothetical protein F2Q68_00004861 [Brassica cretica]|uniref:Uncharacterized protein n=2 Tax=Brassica cretica TaxID=69181 RepID=A0ABQ7BW93_BRACR|nr:hypothetical protein F2Q68_00004861 [Brassica cretica]KAF3543592.1 hypothetical protein DY000_02007294 [Brassica cretica]
MTTCWETSAYIFLSHLEPSTNEASYGLISFGPLFFQSFFSNLTCIHPMLKISNAALLHSKSGMIRNNSKKDSHDKSPRKVTQGLGQRILDSETPLVQLAEGASWTGFTDQLAHSVSWISPTRRTGKFEATMTEPGAGKELNGSDIEEEHDELNQIDTQGVMGLAGDDTFQSNQDMDPFCLSKGPVTRSQTRRLKKSIAVLVYSKPHGNQAKEPSQLFTYSVFGLV